LGFPPSLLGKGKGMVMGMEKDQVHGSGSSDPGRRLVVLSV
jgi:hypothetical protein